MVYNEKKVELLRQRYPEGTRICLDHMEDLCPVESGTCGWVQFQEQIEEVAETEDIEESEEMEMSM